jgi:Peroxidase
MRISRFATVALVAPCVAFQSTQSTTPDRPSQTTVLQMDRRDFGKAVAAGAASFGLLGSQVAPAGAEVFFDPAMYGDQELRVGTVDSVRERTRRAILQDPRLAPSFYQLALLDGLSYNAESNKYGPNGGIIYSVLNSKDDSQYVESLKGAAGVLIQAEKDLKKKTAVSIADCIAIAGAEAIESIGGPVLPTQLGRMEPDKKKGIELNAALPVDLLSGKRSKGEVRDAFKNAGLTEREMTALLLGLLTLQRVEKTRSTEDWKASTKPKFVERGKMGRMSDYKRLTDEDIKAALDDQYDEDPDDGWYIADSFGSRDDRFGQRIAKDEIDEKNFNKYLKDLYAFSTGKNKDDVFGWIGDQILDKDSPTSISYLKKYADSNLSYTKDLGIAYNAITQLGAVYTGGKYENLLKNKPRKSLGDDLNLGF